MSWRPARGLQLPACPARPDPSCLAPAVLPGARGRACAERAGRREEEAAAMALNRNHSEGGGVIVNNSEK